MSIQDVIMQYTDEEEKNGTKQPEVATNFSPSHWRIVKLGDVLREIDIRAKDLKIVESDEKPVLSLTKNNGLVPQSERFNNRVAIPDISTYKVIKKGQIAYNPFVLWEGAIYALKRRELGLISPAYLVWEANTTYADPYFLDFLLRTPQLLNEYLRVASGVVQRRRAVRKNIFLNISVRLPPLPEQHNIAYALQIVQNAIQARYREMGLECERKAALMDVLFTQSIDNQIQGQQTEIGTLPHHWRIQSLGEVVSQIQYGLSLVGNVTGSYPILRMNNLVEGKIVPDNLQFVELDEGLLQKFLLRKGDVLFNRTNSYELVGKTALFDLNSDFIFASYLLRIVTQPENLLPTYLNFFLNWDVTQQRLKMLATRGVSQSNINASKLKQFRVAVPPLSEQTAIVSILNACEDKIAALDQEITLLEELFQALLEELMTGRLSTLPLIEKEHML